MEHNFIIDKKLSIHPVEGFDNFTQNSVGTKYFAAILDGWAPAQGEHLFVAFERKDGMNKLDPIFMSFKDGVYYTVMPKEVMLDNGEWRANIYKKLNFNADTGKADAQEVGEDFEFLVKRTIRDDSGNAVTQYDVVNLYSGAKEAERRAEEAAESAEEKVSISTDAVTRAENAAQAAEQSERNAEESVTAAAESERTALEYAEAANQSAESSAQSADSASGSEQSAAESAERAEQSKIGLEEAQHAAEAAQTAAEQARDKAKDYANLAEAAASSGLRKVIVHALPEEGSDNYLYMVPSGAAADENFYDEFLWIADEETGATKWEKIGTTRTDLTADSIVMQEDITLAGDYVKVGNISKGSETETAVFSAKGKTVAQVLQEIFSKRLQPQITAMPSVSGFTLQAASRVEAGTHFDSFGFGTAVLNAGSYTYGPATNVTAENYEVERICIPSSMSATVATQASGTDDNGGNGFIIGDMGGENVVSSIKYQVTVHYGEGAIAHDNMGAESNPPVRIEAGMATQTTITVTPYRNYFYGTTSETPPQGEEITSDFVRSLTKSNKAYEAGTFTLHIPSGATAVYIACAENKAGVVQVINETALNADVTATFTKQENVMVEGANGYTAVAYNVWYYVPAVPYENETVLKITLGGNSNGTD